MANSRNVPSPHVPVIPVSLLSFPRRRESSLVRITQELDPQSQKGYSTGRAPVSWKALRR